MLTVKLEDLRVRPSLFRDLEDTRQYCRRLSHTISTFLDKECKSFEDRLLGLNTVLHSFKHTADALVTCKESYDLTRLLFIECCKLILSLAYENYVLHISSKPDLSDLRPLLFSVIKECHVAVSAKTCLRFPHFGLLEDVWASPWCSRTLLKMMSDDADTVSLQEAMWYITTQDKDVMKLRLYLLSNQDCEKQALMLSTWCLKHPFYTDDVFMLGMQLTLCYRLGLLQQFYAQCAHIKCCQAVKMLDRIEVTVDEPLHGLDCVELICVPSNKIRVAVLQTFFVQSWVNPLLCPCLKTLVHQWLPAQYDDDQKNDEVFLRGVVKVISIAKKSSQLGILAEGMHEVFGMRFIGFCTKFLIACIKTEDEKLVEYRSEAEDGNNSTISSLCVVVASLYGQNTQQQLSIAKESLLTAFAMNPSQENYNLLKTVCQKLEKQFSTAAREKSNELHVGVSDSRSSFVDSYQAWLSDQYGHKKTKKYAQPASHLINPTSSDKRKEYLPKHSLRDEKGRFTSASNIPDLLSQKSNSVKSDKSPNTWLACVSKDCTRNSELESAELNSKVEENVDYTSKVDVADAVLSDLANILRKLRHIDMKTSLSWKELQVVIAQICLENGIGFNTETGVVSPADVSKDIGPVFNIPAYCEYSLDSQESISENSSEYSHRINYLSDEDSEVEVEIVCEDGEIPITNPTIHYGGHMRKIQIVPNAVDGNQCITSTVDSQVSFNGFTSSCKVTVDEVEIVDLSSDSEEMTARLQNKMYCQTVNYQNQECTSLSEFNETIPDPFVEADEAMYVSNAPPLMDQSSKGAPLTEKIDADFCSIFDNFKVEDATQGQCDATRTSLKCVSAPTTMVKENQVEGCIEPASTPNTVGRENQQNCITGPPDPNTEVIKIHEEDCINFVPAPAPVVTGNQEERWLTGAPTQNTVVKESQGECCMDGAVTPKVVVGESLKDHVVPVPTPVVKGNQEISWLTGAPTPNTVVKESQKESCTDGAVTPKVVVGGNLEERCVKGAVTPKAVLNRNQEESSGSTESLLANMLNGQVGTNHTIMLQESAPQSNVCCEEANLIQEIIESDLAMSTDNQSSHIENNCPSEESTKLKSTLNEELKIPPEGADSIYSQSNIAMPEGELAVNTVEIFSKQVTDNEEHSSKVTGRMENVITVDSMPVNENSCCQVAEVVEDLITNVDKIEQLKYSCQTLNGNMLMSDATSDDNKKSQLPCTDVLTNETDIPVNHFTSVQIFNTPSVETEIVPVTESSQEDRKCAKGKGAVVDRQHTAAKAKHAIVKSPQTKSTSKNVHKVSRGKDPPCSRTLKRASSVPAGITLHQKGPAKRILPYTSKLRSYSLPDAKIRKSQNKCEVDTNGLKSISRKGVKRPSRLTKYRDFTDTCPFCLKVCDTVYHCIRHCIQLHGETICYKIENKKNYICCYCAFSTRSKDLSTNHLLHKHIDVATKALAVQAKQSSYVEKPKVGKCMPKTEPDLVEEATKNFENITISEGYSTQQYHQDNALNEQETHGWKIDDSVAKGSGMGNEGYQRTGLVSIIGSEEAKKRTEEMELVRDIPDLGTVGTDNLTANALSKPSKEEPCCSKEMPHQSSSGRNNTTVPRHMTQVQIATQAGFTRFCPFCQKFFSSIKNTCFHCIRKHSDILCFTEQNDKLLCCYCTSQFDLKKCVTDHILTHHFALAVKTLSEAVNKSDGHSDSSQNKQNAESGMSTKANGNIEVNDNDILCMNREFPVKDKFATSEDVGFHTPKAEELSRNPEKEEHTEQDTQQKDLKIQDGSHPGDILADDMCKECTGACVESTHCNSEVKNITNLDGNSEITAEAKGTNPLCVASCLSDSAKNKESLCPPQVNAEDDIHSVQSYKGQNIPECHKDKKEMEEIKDAYRLLLRACEKEETDRRKCGKIHENRPKEDQETVPVGICKKQDIENVSGNSICSTSEKMQLNNVAQPAVNPKASVNARESLKIKNMKSYVKCKMGTMTRIVTRSSKDSCRSSRQCRINQMKNRKLKAKFQCTCCADVFSNVRTLIIHMQKKHFTKAHQDKAKTCDSFEPGSRRFSKKARGTKKRDHSQKTDIGMQHKISTGKNYPNDMVSLHGNQNQCQTLTYFDSANNEPNKDQEISKNVVEQGDEAGVKNAIDRFDCCKDDTENYSVTNGQDLTDDDYPMPYLSPQQYFTAPGNTENVKRENCQSSSVMAGQTCVNSVTESEDSAPLDSVKTCINQEMGSTNTSDKETLKCISEPEVTSTVVDCELKETTSSREPGLFSNNSKILSENGVQSESELKQKQPEILSSAPPGLLVQNTIPTIINMKLSCSSHDLVSSRGTGEYESLMEPQDEENMQYELNSYTGFSDFTDIDSSSQVQHSEYWTGRSSDALAYIESGSQVEYLNYPWQSYLYDGDEEDTRAYGGDLKVQGTDLFDRMGYGQPQLNSENYSRTGDLVGSLSSFNGNGQEFTGMLITDFSNLNYTQAGKQDLHTDALYGRKTLSHGNLKSGRMQCEPIKSWHKSEQCFGRSRAKSLDLTSDRQCTEYPKISKSKSEILYDPYWWRQKPREGTREHNDRVNLIRSQLKALDSKSVFSSFKKGDIIRSYSTKTDSEESALPSTSTDCHLKPSSSRSEELLVSGPPGKEASGSKEPQVDCNSRQNSSNGLVKSDSSSTNEFSRLRSKNSTSLSQDLMSHSKSVEVLRSPAQNDVGATALSEHQLAPDPPTSAAHLTEGTKRSKNSSRLRSPIKSHRRDSLSRSRSPSEENLSKSVSSRIREHSNESVSRKYSRSSSRSSSSSWRRWSGPSSSQRDKSPKKENSSSSPTCRRGTVSRSARREKPSKPLKQEICERSPKRENPSMSITRVKSPKMENMSTSERRKGIPSPRREKPVRSSNRDKLRSPKRKSVLKSPRRGKPVSSAKGEDQSRLGSTRATSCATRSPKLKDEIESRVKEVNGLERAKKRCHSKSRSVANDLRLVLKTRGGSSKKCTISNDQCTVSKKHCVNNLTTVDSKSRLRCNKDESMQSECVSNQDILHSDKEKSLSLATPGVFQSPNANGIITRSKNTPSPDKTTPRRDSLKSENSASRKTCAPGKTELGKEEKEEKRQVGRENYSSTPNRRSKSSLVPVRLPDIAYGESDSFKQEIPASHKTCAPAKTALENEEREEKRQVGREDDCLTPRRRSKSSIVPVRLPGKAYGESDSFKPEFQASCNTCAPAKTESRKEDKRVERQAGREDNCSTPKRRRKPSQVRVRLPGIAYGESDDTSESEREEETEYIVLSQCGSLQDSGTGTDDVCASPNNAAEANGCLPDANLVGNPLQHPVVKSKWCEDDSEEEVIIEQVDPEVAFAKRHRLSDDVKASQQKKSKPVQLLQGFSSEPPYRLRSMSPTTNSQIGETLLPSSSTTGFTGSFTIVPGWMPAGTIPPPNTPKRGKRNVKTHRQSKMGEELAYLKKAGICTGDSDSSPQQHKGTRKSPRLRVNMK